MSRNRSRTRIQKEHPRRESNDKENKTESNYSFRANGRRIIKQDPVEQDEADNNEEVENPNADKKDENKEEPKVNGDHSKYKNILNMRYNLL